MSSTSSPIEQTLVRRSQRISTLARKTQVSAYSADKKLRIKSTRSVVKTVQSKTEYLQATPGILLKETVVSQPELVISDSYEVEKEQGPQLETFLTEVADPKKTTFGGRLGYVWFTCFTQFKSNTV